MYELSLVVRKRHEFNARCFSENFPFTRSRAKQPRIFVIKENYRVSYTTYELTLVFQENFPLFTRK